MKLNLHYIKDFFEPKRLTYEIRLPLNDVSQKLNEILNEELPAFDPGGFSGSITGNEFVMGLIPADAPYAGVSVAVRGTIAEQKTGKTTMEIYIIRDTATYIAFFITLLAAAIYIIMLFNTPHTQYSKYLFGGSIGFIFVACLFIWFSNRSITGMQKRFEIFLQNNGLK